MSTPEVPSSDSPFSESEQMAITMLPNVVGAAVAFSSKNGPVGTVKEMMANAKAAVAGVQQYPDNSLIRSVMPHFEDRAEAMEAAKAMREKQVAALKDAGISSKEDMAAHAQAQATEVNALLAKADPAEAAEYRSWVLDVAASVAGAAKEGGFLGIGGEEVGEGEEQMMSAISAALGVS